MSSSTESKKGSLAPKAATAAPAAPTAGLAGKVLPSIETSFDKAPGGSNHTTPSATPTVKRPTPLVGRWGDYAWDNFCAAEGDDTQSHGTESTQGGPGAIGTPLTGKTGVPAIPEEDDEETGSPKADGNNTAQPSPRDRGEEDEASPGRASGGKPPAGPPQTFLLGKSVSPRRQQPPPQVQQQQVAAQPTQPQAQPQQYLTDPARENKTPDFSAPSSYNNRMPAGGKSGEQQGMSYHQPQAQPGAFVGPGISSPPTASFEAERTGSNLANGGDFSALPSRQQSTMSIASNQGNRNTHAPYFSQKSGAGGGGGSGGSPQQQPLLGSGNNGQNSPQNQSLSNSMNNANNNNASGNAATNPNSLNNTASNLLPSDMTKSLNGSYNGQQQAWNVDSSGPAVQQPSGHHYPGAGNNQGNQGSGNQKQQQGNNQNSGSHYQNHTNQRHATPPAAHFGMPHGQPHGMFGMPPGVGGAASGMPPFAQSTLPQGFMPPPMPPGMPPGGLFNPMFNAGAGGFGATQNQSFGSGSSPAGSHNNRQSNNASPAVANGGAATAPIFNTQAPTMQVTRFPPPPPPSHRCLQILEGDGSDPAVGRTIAKRWFKKQLASQVAHPSVPPCPEPDFTLHSLENWLRVSGEWWKLNYADMKTSAIHGPPSAGPAPQPGSATRRRKEQAAVAAAGGSQAGGSQPPSRTNRGGGAGSNPSSQPPSQPGSRSNRLPKRSADPNNLADLYSNPPSLPPSQPGSRSNRVPHGGGSQPSSRSNRVPLRDQHTPHNFVMDDFRGTSGMTPPPGAQGGSQTPPPTEVVG